MIHRNVEQYMKEQWKDSLETISESSLNTTINKPLVVSDKCVYSFDKIVSKIFDGKNLPSSVDSICFQSKNIWFVEFKSGFANVITVKNYKYPFTPTCEETKAALELLKEKHLKLQKKKEQELIDSLKLKAVESYVVFEKNILPLCETVDYKRNLFLYVVVDNINSEDSFEFELGELAGKSVENNILSKVKAALHRYISVKSANGESYYYDEIRVCSVKEFMGEVEKLPESPIQTAM